MDSLQKNIPGISAILRLLLIEAVSSSLGVEDGMKAPNPVLNLPRIEEPAGARFSSRSAADLSTAVPPSLVWVWSPEEAVEDASLVVFSGPP